MDTITGLAQRLKHDAWYLFEACRDAGMSEHRAANFVLDQLVSIAEDYCRKGGTARPGLISPLSLINKALDLSRDNPTLRNILIDLKLALEEAYE